MSYTPKCFRSRARQPAYHYYGDGESLEKDTTIPDPWCDQLSARLSVSKDLMQGN